MRVTVTAKLRNNGGLAAEHVKEWLEDIPHRARITGTSTTVEAEWEEER